MKCPHCGHGKHRVLETRTDRRVRQCLKCKRDFFTMETVCAFAGKELGWVPQMYAVREDSPEPEPPKAKPLTAKGVLKFNRFHPAQVGAELDNAHPALRHGLISWWNEARWSKHKGNASWTQGAWLSNVNRVLAMPHNKAVALVQRGIEQGWQSLQEDYVKDVSAADHGTFAPKNSAMQKAIDSWNL